MAAIADVVKLAVAVQVQAVAVAVARAEDAPGADDPAQPVGVPDPEHLLAVRVVEVGPAVPAEVSHRCRAAIRRESLPFLTH